MQLLFYLITNLPKSELQLEHFFKIFRVLPFATLHSLIIFRIYFTGIASTVDHTHEKGLPFMPLSLVFDHIYYYVDMPAVSSFYIYFVVMYFGNPFP